MKECLKCSQVKPIDDFHDQKLVTGYGRFCKICKITPKKEIPVYTSKFEPTDINCPKCGAKMIVRHRNIDNQKFYGCSRFPECRGIRKFDS